VLQPGSTAGNVGSGLKLAKKKGVSKLGGTWGRGKAKQDRSNCHCTVHVLCPSGNGPRTDRARGPLQRVSVTSTVNKCDVRLEGPCGAARGINNERTDQAIRGKKNP